MTTTPSIRRLSIAITAAVASLTLAIGVTAASLLGWFAPPQTTGSEPPPLAAPPSVNPSTAPGQEAAPTVPAGEIVVSPNDITLAMHGDEYEDDERDHYHAPDGRNDHDEDSDD